MYKNHTMKLATAMMATLLFCTSLAHAEVNKRHVQLVTPAPFKWDEYGPTNPLNPDGSDYPCKIPQGEAFTINGGVATEMVIGEAQQVSFSGWAVHGGGSCQFALTEGFAPTRDSAWKVIHSIEGGCPKAHVEGNLDPSESPDTYTFTVPDDFAPGNYTWAWTWVNRIAGSPEFYMNCAPITVKASAGTTRRVKARRQAYSGRRVAAATTTTTYPDLFLANIGSVSNGCNTSEALYEQIAIAYPSPGDSVSYPNGQDNLFQQPCDGNPRNNNNGAAANSGGSQPSATAGSAATTTGGSGGVAATTSAVISAMSSSPSSTAAVSSTEAMSSATTVLSSTALVSSTFTSPTASDALVPSSTASAATSTSTTALSSPCTDGHLLCVGGTQFSTCTGGKWDAPQNLATNTTCEEEGESVGLNVAYHWL